MCGSWSIEKVRNSTTPTLSEVKASVIHFDTAVCLAEAKPQYHCCTVLLPHQTHTNVELDKKGERSIGGRVK